MGQRARSWRALWRLAVIVTAVSTLLGAAVAPAAAVGSSTVKNSGWVTSTDPDLAGLSIRLWMIRNPISTTTPCSFQLLADFDWTNRPPNRFWGGSLQSPDSLGITFSVTENKFVRQANSDSYILMWSNGTTRAADDVDRGATGVVWSFRELDAVRYMSSGQVRFVITRGAPCSGFTMTAQAQYISNDGLASGPINVSVSWFLGVGFDVGGTSPNGKLEAEWTYRL